MTPANSPCYDCKHFMGGHFCKAFLSEPIPADIWFHKKKHDSPFPGQYKDFVFTPKDSTE